MRLLMATILVLASAGTSLVPADLPLVGKHQVQLGGHTFTLPDGFEIELAAGPPLVNRPIVADFDEEGRLYVADSSGSNEKVDIQLQKKPHHIVRLEDTKGTGRFDNSTIFADKMMFPEGVMWYAGSLYVAAPPSIWKLTDTRGQGVADQRVEWFQGKTLTGCANDLHGPYLGPDGWIYWCKGAFARQTYERPGKPPFSTKAAHIFRCRPDGSGLEAVMTGGMDNPVDVVFTPGGERIFTTTFFQHPGGGLRDGLIHAVYGGVYGKDHDPIYEHKWTGPTLMPVLTHMGPAAPCGLTRYESDSFGPDYKDNLFACQFNMHKVSRHVLTPSGATFACKDDDFLVSDNLDFHPTDVIEDADGSLLVCDTGGWYKLCCPTSQLVKPDVLGAIYRIRRKDAKRIEDPRGLKLPWKTITTKDLIGLLDDERPVVQKRVMESLANRGAEAAELLFFNWLPLKSARWRRNAIWTASRIDAREARWVAQYSLSDKDDIVRLAALHAISLWRDKASATMLAIALDAGGWSSPHDERVVAEALGRIGDKTAVRAILTALGRTDDRVLRHSLIYALIEIGDRKGTAAGLKSSNPRIHGAAMIALDQMDGGGLEAKVVAAELNATDLAMKETAAWIVGRHPEWGGALAGFLRERFNGAKLSAAEEDELVKQLARFARNAAIQDLLGEAVRNGVSHETQVRALRAMARGGLKQAPDAWITALTQLLEKADEEILREALETARALTVPKPKAELLTAVLLRIGEDSARPTDVRLQALAAVPGGLTNASEQVLGFLLAQIHADQPVVTRALAADALSRARLNSEQLIALAAAWNTIAPTEVEHLLDAFVQSTDDAVGLKLIAALQASPLRSSLRAAALKPRLVKFGPKVEKQAQQLYAALNADEAAMRVKLDQLAAQVGGGDVRRGQLVFHSQKASCFVCHAIGYRGGDVGPDLTRIGAIRAERDLLESIVFPSASFVRGYEPVLIATTDGKVHNGLVKKETPEEILLATGVNQQERILRTNIEAMQPSKVSVMPAGLEQQLTPQELADLIAFLKACK